MLDKEFREFLPGYAVTSYGSQGKTVDYVLFSDSTIKAATNAHLGVRIVALDVTLDGQRYGERFDFMVGIGSDNPKPQ